MGSGRAAVQDGQVGAPARLVVIGASAGGVDALSTLVATLPREFPAPIVVAQHLDPTRVSRLAAILAKRGPLPVRTVLATEPLEPGVIYVVPSGHDVEITDQAVSLGSVAEGRSKPSIDRLFSTAADQFGENLIAVILTGTGSDGADGARHVKDQGGTVVIQDPHTASHPEMPLSLAPTVVDIAAELDSIGPLLHDLALGTYPALQPDEERRMDLLLDQVRARSGIDFSIYRAPTIRRRLQRRMHDTGSVTLDDYIRYVRRHPEEYQRLASSFLIKVTDFFRDPDLFEYVRTELLPDVMAAMRARVSTSKPQLRLWSAGCATGEEAYSLAILVAEQLGDDLDNVDVRIFATDLDAEAVAFARRGVYPASAIEALPPALIARHFTRLDGAYEISKRVRSLVLFAQHDLGQRAAFPRIDLVLCRNVLIYFTPELQRRALQLFAFALREGGVLVLGKSETTQPLPELFTVVQPRLKVFHRHGERIVTPTGRLGGGSGPPPSGAAGDRRLSLGGRERLLTLARARQTGLGQAHGDGAEQLAHLPVGVIVVAPAYAIRSINVAARRLLSLHTRALDEDLVHLVQRRIAAPLRDTIDQARRTGAHLGLMELSSVPDEPGRPRYVEILAARLQGETESGDGAVALVVTDRTEPESERRRLADEAQRARAEADRQRGLLDESTITVRELMRANLELAGTNEELRSGNEELLVGQEEAQAAMEEIETLNEEQQASNEELETLNEELQATIEELNATNDDLQLRADELRSQAMLLEQQRRESEVGRQRLLEVLDKAPSAIILVRGRDHVFELVNPPAVRLLGRAEVQLLDRPVAEVLPVLARRLLTERLDHVYATGEPFFGARVAIELDPDDGREPRTGFWDLGCLPLRDTAGNAEGVLVQAIDRTDEVVSGHLVDKLTQAEQAERALRHLQEEFLALAGHELRTPLAALQGALQMVQRTLAGGGADARVRHYADLGLQQARLLDLLVRDLTDLVRLQSGKFAVQRAPVELRELVANTVELAQPLANGQELRTELPGTTLVVSGDARRLQQVLLNLLVNAITHASQTPYIDVQLGREGDGAVLLVRDFGPGVPTEERERIFSRFHQVEQGATGGVSGLGLGLFISRQIVEAHGGRIEVHAPEGSGACFRIDLPLLTEGRCDA